MNTLCSKCVLDTTVPELTFDQNGECQYCKVYDELDKLYPLNEEGAGKLRALVERIKRSGANKEYDCVLGVSGGTDSTYTLYQCVQLGLRPLAVHFDNGWNTKLAVKNIKKTCAHLDVDLVTYVVDWEEFKDLQISFLKASTPDAEIPTDIGIHATLIRIADEEGLKYVLNGHSFRTEGVSPIGWTYMDGKYIKAVQKKFGSFKLNSFPNYTITDLIRHNFIKRIKVVPILNYFDYDKASAKKLLLNELDWEYSGGHHHESVYTKFFQSYLLPQKFKIDKRKTEYSAMILSGHISREEALKELENNAYPYDQEVVDYTINKLGLSAEEFEKILDSPVKGFKDYPTYYPLIKAMKIPIKIACDLNILPKLLYSKFLQT
ncbi:MAG: N-acetyl sugar amidotransferase [Flavobacteriales bacterium]|nr:N-acetyl sugar amidotransferase [Flavobacteriales bacterium]